MAKNYELKKDLNLKKTATILQSTKFAFFEKIHTKIFV